ncbi:response regulator transcription factor [Micromonospora sp. NPDC048063]|uniref:response regulator n=1 Tax=Micromonospora sp. NPDC048063 TaxID=3364256 RepID=UPI0037179F1E
MADDGALFREGLQLLLSAAGHQVVGCVEDGDRLLELLARTPVDVAILDIRMPPGADGGLQTAQRVRAECPDVGLLVTGPVASVGRSTISQDPRCGQGLPKARG